MKCVVALILGLCPAFSSASAGESVDRVKTPQSLLSEKAPSFWERETLTGDWAGARAELEEKGLHFFANYSGEYFNNPSGGVVFKANGHERKGGGYGGLLNAGIDLDLEKLTGGIWKGASFGANALNLHGEDRGSRYVGSLANPSNIAGYDTVRLGELWFQQNFFEDKISLRLGQLLADCDFFGCYHSSLFVNGTFGAFTPTGLNYPGFSSYPLATPGVRLRVQASDSLSFQLGAYSSSEGETGDKHSIHFPVDPNNDGVLSLYEANYSAKPFGLTGTYKLGAIIHTNDSGFYRNFKTGRFHHGSFGLYGAIDQTFFCESSKDDQGLGFFARAYGAPGDVNTVDLYVDSGLNYTGLIPGRNADVFGVAYGYTKISRDYSNASVAAGGSALENEGVLEVTYRAQITPWWYVQPDLQYTLDPSAAKGSADALVLGVRTGLTF
jgi:porin